MRCTNAGTRAALSAPHASFSRPPAYATLEKFCFLALVGIDLLMTTMLRADLVRLRVRASVFGAMGSSGDHVEICVILQKPEPESPVERARLVPTPVVS